MLIRVYESYESDLVADATTSQDSRSYRNLTTELIFVKDVEDNTGYVMHTLYMT
jgi:hypothetical protein